MKWGCLWVNSFVNMLMSFFLIISFHKMSGENVNKHLKEIY